MAVVFKDSEGNEIGTRINAYKLDPLAVKINPHLNGRYDLPEIDALVSDMLSTPDGVSIKGQTTPVGIMKDGSTPLLVYGHRRLRAVLKINREKLAPGGAQLPLLCVYLQVTKDVEALSIAVSENRDRVGMTLLDEAYCIKQFLRLGKDHEWIALYGGFFPKLIEKQTSDDGGKSQKELKQAIGWVKKREKLLNLAPEAGKALIDGTLKPSAAEHLAELEVSKQRDLVEKGKVTAKDIRKAAGKVEKLSVKQVKNELDSVIADYATVKGVPKELLDVLQNLRDRL